MMASPKLVNKQFNSPIKLYSPQAIQETLDRQTQVLSNGAVGIDFNQLAKPTNLQNSAVLRMLEEEEERKRLGKAGLKRVAWPPPAEDQGDLADYSEQGPVQSKTRGVGEYASYQSKNPTLVAKDIPIIVEQPVKQPPQQYQSNLRQPSQFISQQPPTGAKPWISSQIQQQQQQQHQHQQQQPQQWHQQPQPQQQHPHQWQQQQQQEHHPHQWQRQQNLQQSQHLHHQDSGNTILNTWNKEDLKKIQARQQRFDQTTEVLESPPVTNPWSTDKPHQLIHQQQPFTSWKEPSQHNQQTELGHQDHQSPQFYYPQNTAPHFEPPPSVITLRSELPTSQEPAPVYQAQPAAINPNSGSMRGDQKWPPQSVRDQTEAENKARIELAKGPVCRPRRVNKDYSGFFAQHAVTNNYPGYRAPPGTQYFTPAYQH